MKIAGSLTPSMDSYRGADNEWLNRALSLIDSERTRSADTNMIRFPLPESWGVDLYLKDEAAHPTGSLKHRLARALFVYALCSGKVTAGTTIIEASSGSTAVSEAYFARLLGLPFIAVVPRSTSVEKIRLIEFYGGRCHLVADSSMLHEESLRLAAQTGGYFMDQFMYAERATDWRCDDNIANSIFRQLEGERHAIPSWIVLGAGTGGTSASVGRFVRFARHATKVCVVDPENSAYFPYWSTGVRETNARPPSRVEGIGRPTVEPSFVASVIDHMIAVPDAASFAAMRWGSQVLSRQLGGSTGTNLWGALQIAQGMRDTGETGSIVTLLCDSGERYLDTYYSDEWLADAGHDIAPHLIGLAEISGLPEGADRGDLTVGARKSA